DQWLLGGHLLRPEWDPEGLLSTLPAIATTMMGVLTGHWLRSGRSSLERVVGMFVIGTLGLVAGLIMNAWFPIHKTLWSSSYAVFSGGQAPRPPPPCSRVLPHPR